MSLFLFWFRKVIESYQASVRNINEIDYLKKHLKWLQVYCQEKVWECFIHQTSDVFVRKFQKIIESDDLIYEKDITKIQEQLNLKIIED